MDLSPCKKAFSKYRQEVNTNDSVELGSRAKPKMVSGTPKAVGIYGHMRYTTLGKTPLSYGIYSFAKETCK